MNIRLDNDIRVRLDHEDVLNWRAKRNLSRTYEFGGLTLNFEMKSDPGLHALVPVEGGLVIVLGAKEADQLCQNDLPKAGIVIGKVHIQIDCRDARRLKPPGPSF